MAPAYKIERYSYTQQGWDNRYFLDIYFHRDGTCLFNLREPCGLNIYATNHNRGTKLTHMGNPIASWRINREGEVSENLPQKANKQEKEQKRGREQDNWRNWDYLAREGRFKLEATIYRRGV